MCSLLTREAHITRRSRHHARSAHHVPLAEHIVPKTKKQSIGLLSFLVAGVGFFIARPSRIVVCSRLRLLGLAYFLLCGVSRRENTTPWCFRLLTHSLCRREAAAEAVARIAPRQQQKDRPPEWVVCSFVVLS